MEPDNRETSLGRNGALLQRATKGDREAMGELLTPYIPRLYQTTFRILKNRQDAEDALQDGLLSAVRNVRGFEGRSQFSTWLTRIVVNAALMQMRRSHHQRFISLDESEQPYRHWIVNSLPDRAANPLELCEERQRNELIARGVGGLQTACRRAVWLRHMQGLKIREVAAILGLSTGSVKSQLHRAKMRLRKELGKVRQRERSTAG